MALTVSDLVHSVLKGAGLSMSFVGVDIGSSSTKIVQLSVRDGVITLDTYGDISNTLYEKNGSGAVIRGNTLGTSAGLQDLLHEISSDSRRCGVAVSLSETLFNVVEMPKRDPAQMAIIVPTEAKQYIPIPMEKVMLDWYAIPDPEDEGSVFDALKPHTQTVAKTQKVMIVAVQKETALVLGNIISDTPLSPEFYEIEMFSIVRSCAHEITASVLILDFGATTTKAYIVNATEVAMAARLIPMGGKDITGVVRKKLSCTLEEAEKAKCERGVFSDSDVGPVIAAALAPAWMFIKQMLEEYTKGGGKPIEKILLTGGGAYMPGLKEFTSMQLSLPVEMADSFKRSKGPMILEDTLKEDGPRYAVAMGLALRGVGK